MTRVCVLRRYARLSFEFRQGDRWGPGREGRAVEMCRAYDCSFQGQVLSSPLWIRRGIKRVCWTVGYSLTSWVLVATAVCICQSVSWAWVRRVSCIGWSVVSTVDTEGARFHWLTDDRHACLPALSKATTRRPTCIWTCRSALTCRVELDLWPVGHILTICIRWCTGNDTRLMSLFFLFYRICLHDI